MGKFEFYASIPGDSTCANSENFNLGLKIWEDREYLNSSCNSCKVISVSISYRVLIKDQMFTHIELNWVWEEVKLYSAINQIQASTMQFRTSLLHWQVGKDQMYTIGSKAGKNHKESRYCNKELTTKSTILLKRSDSSALSLNQTFYFEFCCSKLCKCRGLLFIALSRPVWPLLWYGQSPQ